MSGAMPGVSTAARRTEPCIDTTSTTSPSAIPSFVAVVGLISTQLLHIALDMGSGSSCRTGKCASEPCVCQSPTLESPTPIYGRMVGEMRSQDGRPMSALEAIKAKREPEPWIPSVDEFDLLPDAPGVVR